ncbi:MAG: hypothetical protein NZ922_00250 [Candidatus Methanomethyliaceae archaeon]|nr:hypothetical protein [Candidatus Methanomethyliaceae archaeon]MDW7970494.1 hypothetical protein [Nitrososphaerota archaeon]
MRDLLNKFLPIIGIIAMAFIMSGGMFLIIMGPSAGTIAKSSTAETILEFLSSFFLIILGGIGFVLLEGAMRKTFDISGAKMRFLLAASLSIISLILLEALIWIKFN